MRPRHSLGSFLPALVTSPKKTIINCFSLGTLFEGTVSRRLTEGVVLFLHRYGKAFAAGGATDDVLAGDAREAQHVFAMRAFAEDVRFSLAHLQIRAAHGGEQLAEEAAEGGVLPSALGDVARKKAKEGVAEGDEIQDRKKIAEDAVRVKNTAEEDEDQREDEEDMVERVGTVSACKKACKAVAEAVWSGIAHGGDPFFVIAFGKAPLRSWRGSARRAHRE